MSTSAAAIRLRESVAGSTARPESIGALVRALEDDEEIFSVGFTRHGGAPPVPAKGGTATIFTVTSRGLRWADSNRKFLANLLPDPVAFFVARERIKELQTAYASGTHILTNVCGGIHAQKLLFVAWFDGKEASTERNEFSSGIIKMGANSKIVTANG